MNDVEKTRTINQTRQWLEQGVIGLNLCPFARKPFQAGRVRFAVSDSRNAETLMQDLFDELEKLAKGQRQAAPPTSNRADTAQPMYTSPRPSFSGGGGGGGRRRRRL